MVLDTVIMIINYDRHMFIVQAKGFNEIWHKFQSFCTNDSEQNEAMWLYVLKKALFSVLIPPNAYSEQSLNEMYRNFSASKTILDRK